MIDSWNELLDKQVREMNDAGVILLALTPALLDAVKRIQRYAIQNRAMRQ